MPERSCGRRCIFYKTRRASERDAAFRYAVEGRAQRGECAGGCCDRNDCGLAPEKIREAVRNFKAVEHRLEYVATVNGVEFYNDSKATNVDATIKALESFPANIHIIFGGKDKGSDYTVLKPLLQTRVKGVYTIGAAAEKIESHIRGAAQITNAGTLKQCGKEGDGSWPVRRRRAAGSSMCELRSVHQL